MSLNAVVFEDDLAVITRPVPGLPGVFVKICGPGFRHDWRGVKPPHEAPIVRVSHDEWCDVEDSITKEDWEAGRYVGTDLIIEERDPLLGIPFFVSPCNLWDPRRERWIILSQADAAVPFAQWPRVAKPKPWLPGWQ